MTPEKRANEALRRATHGEEGTDFFLAVEECADAIRAAVAAETARCAALVRQLAEPYRVATAQPPPEGSLAGLRAAVLLRAAEAIERGPTP